MSRYHASPALEAFILSRAPLHHATPDAPSTFEALHRAYVPGGSLPVFDGGCDQTIYSTPAVNHAFRAWHDGLHLERAAQFNAAGEFDLAGAHVREARAAGLSVSDQLALYFDIWGQFLYAEHHGGEFPIDQSAFIAECFRAGVDAASLGNF